MITVLNVGRWLRVEPETEHEESVCKRILTYDRLGIYTNMGSDKHKELFWEEAKKQNINMG